MILGRVIGELVSTIHHPFCSGPKKMIVEKIEPAGAPVNEYLVAIDSVGAGPGESVLVLDEGNGARQVLNAPNAPVRSVIVGIVDAVDVPRPD